MSEVRPTRRRNWIVYFGVLLFTAAATFAVALLLVNISQRKHEAREVVFRVVEVNETTPEAEVWGRNWPSQYDSYRRTVDIQRTRYGGSEAFQRLDADPHLRAIFDGYAFAIDYREERGHAYMLSDQRETERVLQRPQPGACLQCHASAVVAYRKAGIKAGAPGTGTEPLTSDVGMAQLTKGFEEVCAMPYADATKLVTHPVSCIDCHDPTSMQLRVTRPGFIAGIRALAASDDPVPHLPSVERWRTGSRAKPYDPNIDATRAEMRSFACGQCHVEYYFKGEKKAVTYPWHKGLKVEQIEAYYDEVGWNDWKHARTGAGVLKAQHPEFETWSQGIHARSGVSCADCHMPYKREGAIKVSDHQVRSPMLNIARACQTCHHYPETELASRVESIQKRTADLLQRAEEAVVALIGDLEAAVKAGVPEAALAKARALQRRAQWRADFVNAENSMGFHAPQETARILGEAIDYARQGQLAVAEARRGGPSASAEKPPEVEPARQ